jgi:hypothetical protein
MKRKVTGQRSKLILSFGTYSCKLCGETESRGGVVSDFDSYSEVPGTNLGQEIDILTWNFFFVFLSTRR